MHSFFIEKYIDFYTIDDLFLQNQNRHQHPVVTNTLCKTDSFSFWSATKNHSIYNSKSKVNGPGRNRSKV